MLSTLVERLHSVVHAVTHVWASIFSCIHSPSAWGINSLFKIRNLIGSHFQLWLGSLIRDGFFHTLYQILIRSLSFNFIFWNKTRLSWISSFGHWFDPFLVLHIQRLSCFNFNSVKWDSWHRRSHQAPNVKFIAQINLVVALWLFPPLNHLLKWPNRGLQHLRGVLSHSLKGSWRFRPIQFIELAKSFIDHNFPSLF